MLLPPATPQGLEPRMDPIPALGAHERAAVLSEVVIARHVDDKHAGHPRGRPQVDTSRPLDCGAIACAEFASSKANAPEFTSAASFNLNF